MERIPRIGVAVIVRRQGRILLGLRQGSHGQGDWALPGGHLEFGEDILDCARREVREETGLEIGNLRLGPYTNDIFAEEGKHYVTLFVVGDYVSGEARVLEPEKCREWGWFSLDDLPEPRFLSLRNLITQGLSRILAC